MDIDFLNSLAKTISDDIGRLYYKYMIREFRNKKFEVSLMDDLDYRRKLHEKIMTKILKNYYK